MKFLLDRKYDMSQLQGSADKSFQKKILVWSDTQTKPVSTESAQNAKFLSYSRGNTRLNPLKTKRRPLYLKTQSVLRC